MTTSAIVPAPEELRGILSQAVRGGAWEFQWIAEELTKRHWALWFKLRLANEDPFFGYTREEQEFGQSHLFNSLFRDLYESQSVDQETVQQITDSAAEGLYHLMQDMNLHLHMVRSRILYDVFDLIGRVHVIDTPFRENIRNILRQWITSSVLLNENYSGQILSKMLHRYALFALAELQVQGDDSDKDIWIECFEEDPFRIAAFAGMVRSVESHPPEGWVRDLLAYLDEGPMGTPVVQQIVLQPLLRREGISDYLWEEAQKTEDPQATWDRLVHLSD